MTLKPKIGNIQFVETLLKEQEIAKQDKFVRTNERIRISPISVIDDEGVNLGNMSAYDALNLAREKGLDLVEINPTSRPPICKIMDWGRHKYDLAKKEKERKLKQKETELKEIRLTAKIGDHDLSYKAKQSREFLEKGHKLKVSMRLRGRENAFVENAINVFYKFGDMVGLEYESRPRKLGNTINAMVSGIKKESKGKNAEIKDTQSNG